MASERQGGLPTHRNPQILASKTNTGLYFSSRNLKVLFKLLESRSNRSPGIVYLKLFFTGRDESSSKPVLSSATDSFLDF